MCSVFRHHRISKDTIFRWRGAWGTWWALCKWVPLISGLTKSSSPGPFLRAVRNTLDWELWHIRSSMLMQYLNTWIPLCHCSFLCEMRLVEGFLGRIKRLQSYIFLIKISPKRSVSHRVLGRHLELRNLLRPSLILIIRLILMLVWNFEAAHVNTDGLEKTGKTDEYSYAYPEHSETFVCRELIVCGSLKFCPEWLICVHLRLNSWCGCRFAYWLLLRSLCLYIIDRKTKTKATLGLSSYVDLRSKISHRLVLRDHNIWSDNDRSFCDVHDLNLWRINS